MRWLCWAIPGFALMRWYLPDEPLLGFVDIPAGPFVMGSDEDKDPQTYDNERPQHSVNLPLYYIARYPVTVAQYRVFVEQSGHEPEESDCPACSLILIRCTNITWHEALKYCEWLTERLRQWEGTPEPLATLLRKEGWQVRCPARRNGRRQRGARMDESICGAMGLRQTGRILTRQGLVVRVQWAVFHKE